MPIDFKQKGYSSGVEWAHLRDCVPDKMDKEAAKRWKRFQESDQARDDFVAFLRSVGVDPPPFVPGARAQRAAERGQEAA